MPGTVLHDWCNQSSLCGEPRAFPPRLLLRPAGQRDRQVASGRRPDRVGPAAYPTDEMTAYPISTLVNSPKNDVAACIEAAT
jgi:hypothetical protein